MGVGHHTGAVAAMLAGHVRPQDTSRGCDGETSKEQKQGQPVMLAGGEQWTEAEGSDSEGWGDEDEWGSWAGGESQQGEDDDDEATEVEEPWLD